MAGKDSVQLTEDGAMMKKIAQLTKDGFQQDKDEPMMGKDSTAPSQIPNEG